MTWPAPMVLAIMRRRDAGEKLKVLAYDYNISVDAVRRLLKGRLPKKNSVVVERQPMWATVDDELKTLCHSIRDEMAHTPPNHIPSDGGYR